ncbi:hypothetical protein BGZ60DRAFT_404333 [Tricladium varicosporioides]|nr:hypothetical protein BGZ60DRAFT_404333 [Hymenoscyphus varicosporioides]
MPQKTFEPQVVRVSSFYFYYHFYTLIFEVALPSPTRLTASISKHRKSATALVKNQASELSSDPPYVIKWAGPEFGEGLFASKPILQDTIITIEPCLLTIKESNFLGNPAQRIQHLIFALDTLPPEDRKYIEGLHPPSGGISAVVQANGFAFDDGHVTRRLYRDISRINHSCRPNAELKHGKDGMGIVRAVRGIEEGEEITMVYGGFGRAIAQIDSGYGFRCKCGSCAGFDHDGRGIPFERNPTTLGGIGKEETKKLSAFGKLQKVMCKKWHGWID